MPCSERLNRRFERPVNMHIRKPKVEHKTRWTVSSPSMLSSSLLRISKGRSDRCAEARRRPFAQHQQHAELIRWQEFGCVRNVFTTRCALEFRSSPIRSGTGATLACEFRGFLPDVILLKRGARASSAPRLKHAWTQKAVKQVPDVVPDATHHEPFGARRSTGTADCEPIRAGAETPHSNVMR